MANILGQSIRKRMGLASNQNGPKITGAPAAKQPAGPYDPINQRRDSMLQGRRGQMVDNSLMPQANAIIQDKTAQANEALKAQTDQARAQVAVNEQNIVAGTNAIQADATAQAQQDELARTTPNLNTKTGLYDAAPAQLDEMTLAKGAQNMAFDPKAGQMLTGEQLRARAEQTAQNQAVTDQSRTNKENFNFNKQSQGKMINAVRPNGQVDQVGFGGQRNYDPNWTAGGFKPIQQSNGAVVSPVEQQIAASNRAAQVRQSAQDTVGMGMTHENRAGRARQLEDDKTKLGLASANQEYRRNKLVADVQGKVAPVEAIAEGRVKEAYINRGVDPEDPSKALPGLASQQLTPDIRQDPVTKLWYDAKTGKTAQENVANRMDMTEDQKRIAKEAANLDPALEKEAKMPWSIDDVWLFNRNTGQFEVGNVDEPNKKNSPYRALTEEERSNMLGRGAPAAQAPGLAGGQPAAQPSQAQQAQAPANANAIRAELLNDTDPDVKKAKILAALKSGALTKEDARALALEHQLQ